MLLTIIRANARFYWFGSWPPDARSRAGSRKRPTQARAQRTYRAIVEAGARVLERHGYEALTTNRVAELAGVGIASLYEYFPTSTR
jgi:AcrR family transcriptional regulator